MEIVEEWEAAAAVEKFKQFRNRVRILMGIRRRNSKRQVWDSGAGGKQWLREQRKLEQMEEQKKTQ